MNTCQACQRWDTPDGALTCARCVTRAQARLTSIAETWAETCEVHATTQRYNRGPGGSARDPLDREAPGGTDRLDWRVSELLVLNEWAAAASDWLALDPPSGDPDQIADWLADRLPRLAEWEECPDLLAELRAIDVAGRRLLGDQQRRKATLESACVTTTEGERCGGTVCFIDQAHAECDQCGRVWDALDLLRRHSPEGAWLDTRRAAFVHGVSDRTLRRWWQSGRIERRGVSEYDVLSVVRGEAVGA